MVRLADRLRRHRDWLVSLALLAALAAYGAIFVDFKGPPFEDAAMLMRYAEHLSQGYGIVWNVGESPVDGATDFLFMTSVAGLIHAGLPTGRAVRVLGLGAHALTVLLTYWINRKMWNAGVILSALTALYLAVGTGLWYVAAYFGTPFFALFASVTWCLSLLLLTTDQPAGWIVWGFSLSGLITGLIRPEGVLLAAFMLLAIVLQRGWQRSKSIVAVFAATVLVLGGTYFAWRWSYFGHPLPNPYYKKGAGLLHWDSFWESVGNFLRFAGPFGLTFVLGLRSRRTSRLTVAFLIPMLLFAVSFVLVSNETNFGGRFQYALWPMVLMSYYPLVSGLTSDWGLVWSVPTQGSAKWVLFAAAAFSTFVLLQYGANQACSLTQQQRTCGIAYEADGRYDLAKRLAEYRGRGYVIATSEAGLLPLYSGWAAIDTWGLNDAWIAQHGEVTEEYLDRYRPNVIAFHAYFSPLVPPGESKRDMQNDWHRMTLTLKSFAESRHYILAAAFGDSPYESHYYYVRPDFPDSETIAREIAAIKPYYWYATGKKAINYAAIRP